jgi:uncharacterized protein YbjT (DUF2867 family)
MMIAVMGAAGNLGSKVADHLLREGEEVRVFEHGRTPEGLRRRGAHVVAGGARDVGDLRLLFVGVAAALVLLPEDPSDPVSAANRSRMGRAIVDALREARVGHIVALSAVPAGRADAAGPPAGLHEFERRLFELADASVLVLRSAFYMDYLLASLPLIRSRRINGSAIRGDLRFPMVATQDVAREAAKRLQRRDFAGHRVEPLLGPEDASLREATAMFGSLLGMPDLPYVHFTPAEMKGALVAAGMSDEAATLLVDMQLSINDGRAFGGVRRTAESTTPTRLEDFLRDALLGQG